MTLSDRGELVEVGKRALLPNDTSTEYSLIRTREERQTDRQTGREVEPSGNRRVPLLKGPFHFLGSC